MKFKVYLIFFRANDGCFYIYDRESNERTLRVSFTTALSFSVFTAADAVR